MESNLILFVCIFFVQKLKSSGSESEEYTSEEEEEEEEEEEKEEEKERKTEEEKTKHIEEKNEEIKLQQNVTQFLLFVLCLIICF